MIESLAEKIHGVYQQEAKRQGDVRHHDTYAELPENIKEFDRVLAIFILSLFAGEAEKIEHLLTDGLDEWGMRSVADIRSLIARYKAEQ